MNTLLLLGPFRKHVRAHLPAREMNHDSPEAWAVFFFFKLA